MPVEEVTWLVGGQERPGRPEKVALDLPGRIRVRPIPAGATLSQMLVDGRIDALCTPRLPRPFVERDPRVRRLFPDVIATERAWFAATGLFPIMHVVVVRRDVYQAHPWVAQSLYKAFELAKADAAERLYDTSALRVMLPWLTQHLEEARELLGDDYWSYGLQPNRACLATFLRYHHEQGLSRRRLQPEELFAPEATESAVI